MTPDELSNLERTARALEPGPAERDQHIARATDYARRYLDGIADAPAYRAEPDRSAMLLDLPIEEHGFELDAALQLIETQVDRPGIAPTSGRFAGYIPGGGLLHAAIADFLAAISNRYAGVAFASPGAAALENRLVRWMADLAGLPRTAAGYLAAGGSGATLSAIVTAREAAGIEGEAIERAVVYGSEHTHHCVRKALKIAGLKRVQWRAIEVDDNYRMRPDALRATIAEDRARGLTPWLLLAAAGATNTGAVDPLGPLAKIARSERLWFHVDAAYGGFFLLTDTGRRRLAGIEHADSLVMDPHKTLFLPYGTGALLVRDGNLLHQAMSEGADYLQDTLVAGDDLSPADLSPELTRHFRGLRMWLPLKVLGLAPFRAALDEKLLLASYFHQRMADDKRFEVGPPPDLSVVTFRLKASDEANKQLLEAIHRDGRIFLSSTRLDGRYTLRMAAVCHRTHKAEIDTMITVLNELAEETL
ncbi:MAG: aminotransferase class V-fold PLP-dependent enzyme [Wenzhouxiangellaceae bacterium]|nr:aminotransferase class V-fold PLP-dependent enzyme [Wenzhouxiangellaceae bacterium]